MVLQVWYYAVPFVKRDYTMPTVSLSKEPEEGGEETAVRTRILDAAFAAFMKCGYAAASTLEIATRARVSKRELYALVGNKQEMLVACISARARRLQVPADLPVPQDRETLAHVLASFGTQLVREITDPTVIAVFRLAIAEAIRAPEVAKVLDSIGRETARAALRQIMVRAQTCGLLNGRPAELAEQFGGLLWGNLMVSLLLGVAERPNSRDIAARARDATAAFLQLHPPPTTATMHHQHRTSVTTRR
jgi:AcrR family transcriptional regulator